MTGIYFSGTGNTKFCVETFLQEASGCLKSYPMEDARAAEVLAKSKNIVFGFSVQGSNMPKMVRDFINRNAGLWRGKKVFIIATMALFSGDGTGVAARLLRKYGAHIIGGLQLKMPDSIGDEKFFNRSTEKNKMLISQAKGKIIVAVKNCRAGAPPSEGLGVFAHFAGLFVQRLYLFWATASYKDKPDIDENKCIGCGKCVSLCPMKNLTMKDKKVFHGKRCTMCYRCVNYCPGQAVTILGKKVVKQSTIEKYI